MQEEERSALIIKPSAMRVNQKKKLVIKKTKKLQISIDIQNIAVVI